MSWQGRLPLAESDNQIAHKANVKGDNRVRVTSNAGNQDQQETRSRLGDQPKRLAKHFDDVPIRVSCCLLCSWP